MDMAFEGGKRTYSFEFEKGVKVTVELEVPEGGVSWDVFSNAVYNAYLACPEAFEGAVEVKERED